MTDTAQESIVNEETEFEDEFNKLAEKKEIVEPVIEDPVELEVKDEIKANDSESGNVEPEPKPAEVDPYAGMDDETKAYFENLESENKKLNHRIASDDGRVRAYQQKTEGLQDQIRNLNESGNGPSTADIAEAMRGGTETWAKFGEDYQDIHDIINERLEQAGKATQEVIEKTLAPIQEQYQRTADQQAEAAEIESQKPISEAFPTWQSEVRTPQFEEWINQQPPGIKDLAQSSVSEDANALLSMYDNDMVANGNPTIRSTPDGVETPAVTQQADKLKAKRERQLNDGATVAGKGANINPGNEVVDDFDSAFQHFAKKRERQRA